MYTAYYPLHEKFILAGHLRFGHIFRSKFEKIPPNERFYLGGPNSVRGYDPDALPPYGVSEKIVKGKTMQAIYHSRWGLNV
jgi:outer membrane protein assembly factor BamA